MQHLKDIQNRLDRLQESQLIDIVKNFKQYGYSDEVRLYAISLLHKKGVSQEDLALTGNLENENYENAGRIYESFRIHATIAFIAYFILVLLKVLSLFDVIPPNLFGLDLLLFYILVLVSYLYCLLRSFIAQADFYKLTGDDFMSGALIYFFLGLPFYFVMYFIFSAQMKERMKTVF